MTRHPVAKAWVYHGLRATSLVFLAILQCVAIIPVYAGEEGYRGMSSTGLYWIDDEQVLFVGYDSSELEAVANGVKNEFQMTASIYAWNFKKNKARTIATRANGVLCYNNGVILYGKRENGKDVRLLGPIGQEKAIDSSAGIADSVRCKILDHNDKESMDHFYKKDRIELETGILELPESFQGQIVYSPKTTGKRIVLNGYRGIDLRTSLVTTGIRYYPFKGGYFMAEQGFNGKRGTAWWLFPDGRTETVSLPKGPWDDGGSLQSSIAPTKVGVIVHHQVRKDWGLYLAASSGFGELIKGAVMRYAVSPDGCKIAYFHQPLKGSEKDKLARVPILKILNVCDNAAR